MELRAGLAGFISPEEARRIRPPHGTAAGPDGIEAREWLGVPCEVMALLFNVMLMAVGALRFCCGRERFLSQRKRGKWIRLSLGPCPFHLC